MFNQRWRLSQGRGVFEKKYPQPMTHYEREQYYLRQRKRKELIEKVLDQLKVSINKIFNNKPSNKIHPQS